MTYNVHDYGAVGDGFHNDTKSIQAAIDVCHAAGGGRVLLSGGHIYRCGTLVLHSYIELHLEMGCILKGSDSLEDYNLLNMQSDIPDKISKPTYEDCSYTGQPTLFFLYAKDCEYVSITGHGKIDGNEKIFYENITPWHIDGSFYPRIPLLFLENVSHLSILQVTLTGSAFWTTHLVGCSDVLIDGIRILNNLKLANCDGIDPDHCKNVRIVNCHIESADDCIVFKNTAHALQYGSCENILVSNCTLTSTSAAIKFGTESEAPFRNIIIQNCNISHSNRGISLQLRDSSCIKNVTFSNINIQTQRFSPIHWWGDAEPIAITAVKRNEDTNIGYIRNINFQNINCSSENGIFIHGDTSCNIQDINFENISLELLNYTDWPKSGRDLRPCIGKGLLTGSVNAIYARNATNVNIKGLNVHVANDIKKYIEKLFDIDLCPAFHMSNETEECEQ